jgi:hypothetical protein
MEAAVMPLLGCNHYVFFGKSSNARRATICKCSNVARPLPAHLISRSAHVNDKKKRQAQMLFEAFPDAMNNWVVWDTKT